MSGSFITAASHAVLVLLATVVAGQTTVFDSHIRAFDKAVLEKDLASAERFLDLAEREAGGDKGRLARVLARRAAVAHRLFEYTRAEDAYRRLLTLAEEGKDRLDVAQRLNHLGNHYRLCGMADRAEDAYRQALLIHEKANRKRAHEMAHLLGDFGDFLRDAGRPGEAEPLFRRGIGLVEKDHAQQHLLASLLASLAEAKVVQARFGEAESLARRSFAVYNRCLRLWTPAQATSQAFSQAVGQAALGEALHRQGKASEAADAFVAALKLADAASVAQPRLLPILRRAAVFYREHGRVAEAKVLDDRAKVIEDKHRTAAEASRASHSAPASSK